MKKAFFQMTSVCLFILLGLTISSQISKKLWGIDYIGEINDVRFIDDENALMATKNGILALLNINKNEIVLRKNNIFGNQWKLLTTNKFSVLFDEITGSVDIFENKNFKIKNTLNLSSPNLSRNWKISVKDLKEKDSFIGVFIDSQVLKVFNEDKILRSFESKTSEVFIDVFINTDKYEVKILSFNTEENKIKVSSLDLKVKSNIIDSFFEYRFENTLSFEQSKTLLTNETFLIYDTATNTFVFGKMNKEKNFEVVSEKLTSLKGLPNCEIENVENTKFIFICESQSRTKTAFLLNPLSQSESKLNPLEFEPKEMIKNIIIDNKNRKSQFVFVVRKTQASNEYSVEPFKFEINDSSFKSLGIKSYNFQDGDEIKIIRGNDNTEENNRFSYVVVTNFHQIRTVHIYDNISEMYIVLNQKYLNITKSEIITVKNLEKKKRSRPTLNTLSSLIHQKDITRVVKNAYNLFVSDIQDVYSNIKNSIESLMNSKNKKTEEIITSKNEKHYLILFSDDSDLFILDAMTGEKKFEKRFQNFNLFNIRTSSNPNPLAQSKQSFKEIENPIITFELKNRESKDEGDLLLIQINLEDFSYQEIDFNLKNYFSLDALSAKINKELSLKDFKEVIEFQTPFSSNADLEAESKSKKELNGKIILTYNQNQNTLYAMKISTSESESTKDSNILKPIWNFRLNSHKLLQYKLANVPENIHTVYNSSGKILYKFIDHNVILLISNIEKTQNISITLISVINGKILFQTQIAGVDLEQKINAIFDENFVIINYVKKNKNVLRNEVYTIEIMRREIEHSLTSLFQKIFNLKTLFSAFNPLDDEEDNFNNFEKTGGMIKNDNGDKDEELVHSDDLVFLTKTFFLPRRVKNMFLNKTKLNVANKYIIFLLESNQVFLIDKRILSPRRPFAKVDPRAPNNPPVIDPLMNSPYADLETTPYFANIVLDPKFIVDVDYFNSQIDNISVQPTKFESTFILCTTGLSLNCYKVYPDKTFDYFVSIFPNVFILIALLVLFVFTFTFRRYVKKLELKQLFLNS